VIIQEPYVFTVLQASSRTQYIRSCTLQYRPIAQRMAGSVYVLVYYSHSAHWLDWPSAVTMHAGTQYCTLYVCKQRPLSAPTRRRTALRCCAVRRLLVLRCAWVCGLSVSKLPTSVHVGGCAQRPDDACCALPLLLLPSLLSLLPPSITTVGSAASSSAMYRRQGGTPAARHCKTRRRQWQRQRQVVGVGCSC
jgi:hypothetical protein